jgi:hypothetical protein
MVKWNTVLVVGAGASAEYGFPLGSGLMEEIRTTLSEVLDGSVNPEFIKAANIIGISESVLKDNANIPLTGLKLAPSIDRYISSHSKNEIISKICKLCICWHILKAERKSSIFYDKISDDYIGGEIADKKWLTYLFKGIVASSTPSDLETFFSGLNIISFNYDRCIRHYMLKSVSDYFNLKEHEAVEVTRKLKVIHPYGQVGRLKWEDPAYAKSTANFGADDADTVARAYNEIITFDEDGSSLSTTHTEVKGLIAAAQRIVFLGYGFHEQNERLLTEGISPKCMRIIFTAVGMHPQVWQETKRIIDQRYNSDNTHVSTEECSDTMCRMSSLIFG